MEKIKESSLSFENCGPSYLSEGLRVMVEVKHTILSKQRKGKLGPSGKVQGRLPGGETSLTMVLKGALQLARPRKEVRRI